MFAPRYFARAYFSGRYWPSGSGAAAAGVYWAPRYWAARYWAPRYFPGIPGVAPPPPAATALNLTVADKLDNTGGLATVRGSEVGSTNFIYVQTWGTQEWVLAASRVGDGTADLDLPAGFYFAYVTSQ